MRIYWIDILKKGKLGIMARPRGNDWLEDEIRKLAHHGVDLLVSLLEESEVYELELEQEAFFCQKYQIDFLHFPIKDRNVPADASAFLACVEQIDEYVQRGQKLVLHCRMGIGRASLLAAGILTRNGIAYSHVFELISTHRGRQVPDTEEQVIWFNSIYKAH